MHMEKESFFSSGKTYYILAATLGVVVLASLILCARNKSARTAAPLVPVASIAPQPITQLACENQYYNPKIGFKEYYLSVEGVDLPGTKSVDCAFAAKVDDKTVAKATAEGIISQAPERGGITFRCTTIKAIEFEPVIPTAVEVALKDNLGVTSSCSAIFTFPAP